MFHAITRKPALITAIGIVTLLVSTQAAPAGPQVRYFAIAFGSQSVPIRPRNTHSWMSVIKATRPGPKDNYLLETHTISWMPATLKIRPLARRSEPGVNLDLTQSFDMVLAGKQRISQWGPYELKQSLFENFVKQKTYLESGQARYLCVDSLSNQQPDKGCIHAISDMDPEFNRRNFNLVRFGEAGTWHIVQLLFQRKRIINQGQDHDWLCRQLGIDRYPVVRRQYVHKRRGPFDDLTWRLRGQLHNPTGTRVRGTFLFRK